MGSESKAKRRWQDDTSLLDRPSCLIQAPGIWVNASGVCFQSVRPSSGWGTTVASESTGSPSQESRGSSWDGQTVSKLSLNNGDEVEGSRRALRTWDFPKKKCSFHARFPNSGVVDTEEHRKAPHLEALRLLCFPPQWWWKVSKFLFTEKWRGSPLQMWDFSPRYQEWWEENRDPWVSA